MVALVAIETPWVAWPCVTWVTETYATIRPERPREIACEAVLIGTFVLLLRGRFRPGPLVPTVETREVTRIPSFAQAGGTQIPIWTDFPRRSAQVAPQIGDRRASPEPVAVVYAVDDETGFEHKRMRYHRVMLGVRVLLDQEILLNHSLRIRKEGPLRADRRAELLECMVVVGGDRDNLGVCHCDLGVERRDFQMLLVLLGAIVTAREREDQRIVTL